MANPMTTEEFIAATQSGLWPVATIERWTVAAGSVVAMVALGPETYDKDTMVEAIQMLALSMPLEVLNAAMQNTDAAYREIQQFDRGNDN